MVVVPIQGKDVYFDGYLLQNLLALKELVEKQDHDNIVLIDGAEGSGKSKLGEIVAGLLDPTYCLDRCVFIPDQLFKAVLEAKKGEAIVYDEAYWGASAMGATTGRVKSYINLLTQIRCKNLHMVVIAPSFFDLQRYVSVWRSKILLHVYLGDRLDRGYFTFYNAERKQKLYFMGRKFYSYCVKPNFRGRFTKASLLDQAAYEAKKLASFSEKMEEAPKGKNDEKAQDQRNVITLIAKQMIPGIRFDDLDAAIARFGCKADTSQWAGKARRLHPNVAID